MQLNEDQLREKHSERYLELEKQIREKDAILLNYKKEHGKLEIFFDRLTNFISPIIEVPILYRGSAKQLLSETPTTAVMQISDGHTGATQMQDEIEGFNEFNVEISERRQTAYAYDFVKWVEMHRNSYRIDEAAVIVTGDLISGDIHEELKITNEFPITMQVCKASEILAKQISILAPHFKKVTVHFITEDNHSRLTKKPQAKEAGINSMNYLVGKMASLYLKELSNVEFNIYPQFEKVIHVENIQYLISHGHNVMGWMGIPWYAIERKVNKESTNRMQIIMREVERAKDIGFHKYIFGHWHTPFDSQTYACCGSVSGCDAYDHKDARWALPSQSSWMVHAKHGEFNRINFRLK